MTHRRPWPRAIVRLATFAAIALCAAGARADTLMLKDGRFFEVPKLVKGEKAFEIHYPHGVISVDAVLVKEFFILDTGGDYQPKNDEEAKKVAQGLVPFEGSWVTKLAREKALAKRNADAKAKLEETRKHSEWRDRYKTASAHFEFEYTVPKEIGERYLEMFEVYYAIFAKEWGVKQPKGKKLKVCFYNNQEDFQRIGGAGPGVLGYFRFVEPIELNVFYARRDEELTLAVIFHEANHYLFNLYCDENLQNPAWLEEGLAEYYGASEWDDKTKKMRVGMKQEGRLVNLIDAIDGDEMQDLKDLMSLPRIDALQYAWSWSLCHLFMENPKYKDKFRKFVQRISQDSKLKRETWPANSSFNWIPVDVQLDTFKKMMGIPDLEAFEKEWYAYIKSMKVESARGYHRAALDCVRWDRPVRAKIYLEKAIGLYIENPDAYSELGKLYLDDDKPAKAVEVLEKGLLIDPLNTYLRVRYGKALYALGDPASKAKGREQQLIALDIDPFDAGLLFAMDSEVAKELGT